jgi:hypothetical protein
LQTLILGFLNLIVVCRGNGKLLCDWRTEVMVNN